MTRDINCPKCGEFVPNVEFLPNGWWVHECPKCAEKLYVSSTHVVLEAGKKAE